MRKRLAVAATVAVTLSASAIAYASSLTLTTPHLGAASLSAPPLFPVRLVTANGGNRSGQAQKSDTLTVDFSDEVAASSLCTGAPTTIGTQSLTGATITISDNGAANGDDLLSVTSVPGTSCPGGVLHFGSVDLGSAAYVSGGNATFTTSTVALTQTASSATVTLTLGNASGTTVRVAGGSPATYTPDTSITNTSGQGIDANLAQTSTVPQF